MDLSSLGQTFSDVIARLPHRSFPVFLIHIAKFVVRDICSCWPRLPQRWKVTIDPYSFLPRTEVHIWTERGIRKMSTPADQVVNAISKATTPSEW